MLECDPDKSINAKTFDKAGSDGFLLHLHAAKAKEAIELLLLGTDIPYRWRSRMEPYFLDEWNDKQGEKAYNDAKMIFKMTGIPLCTRWAGESRRPFSVKEIEFLKDLLVNRFPPNFLKSLRTLQGIVNVSTAFQPAYNHGSGATRIAGHYIPILQRIELYVEAKDSWMLHVLPHEICHAVSEEQRISISHKWRRINWNFSLIGGWTPKEENWWPSEYAKTNMEENWAESCTCYFEEKCADTMRQKNLPMFQFVDDVVKQH
jgi:hypothetical protein